MLETAIPTARLMVLWKRGHSDKSKQSIPWRLSHRLQSSVGFQDSQWF